MAKRVRDSQLVQAVTHQLGGQAIEASIWNFRYGLEKKVKSETFEYLQQQVWQS